MKQFWSINDPFPLLWSADVRNHPVLIHCKRGKVPRNTILSSKLMIPFLTLLMALNSCFLSFSAPHWMSGGLLQKAAELVPIIYIWRVSPLCCWQIPAVRPEVRWILRCHLHEGLHAQTHIPLPRLSSEKQAPTVRCQITTRGLGTDVPGPWVLMEHELLKEL